MRRAAWLLVAVFGGCDPPAQHEPPSGEACRLLIKRQIECAETGRRKYVSMLRGEALTACREERDRTVEDERAALQCVALADCAAFTTCVAQAEHAQEQRRLKLVVARFVRSRVTDDGSRLVCATHRKDDAEFEQLCVQHDRLALAEAQAVLQRERDGGEYWDYRGLCERWRASAAAISKEARESVEGWCEEIAVAEKVKQLKQDVADERYPALPASCEDALRRLDALHSPWAGETRQAVARLCYVEIAAKLLPELAKAKGCEPPLDRIVREVRRFGLADPAIDRWIARVERKCPPEESRREGG